jgi:glycosyltransferase involved in cell wall biosynthesis
MRGGEKVLDAICELYPDAPLYTLVRVPGSVSPRIEARPVVTSPVQWLPGAGRAYRQLLPLFPAAVEWWDLDRYDLVISTSHCAVKSVVRPGRARHLCYCHSPMRYAWDQFPAYFGPAQVGRLTSTLLRPVMAGLARWDRATAARVDQYIANSAYVAARIRRYYNRGSTVVYPPVDTDFYRPTEPPPPSETGFLIVSALVPYKRLDVAIEACRRVGAPLTVVGSGPELRRLQRIAGPDVTFRGWLADDEIRALYGRTSAVLLPGAVDFGLVPVEAQACGTPVVALAKGGACESVVDGTTGILVRDEAIDAFAQGLRDVQRLRVDRDAVRRHAERFSRDRFLREFREVVAGVFREDADPAASRHRGQASDHPPVQPAAREDADPAASRHGGQASDHPPVQPAAREDEE